MPGKTVRFDVAVGLTENTLLDVAYRRCDEIYGKTKKTARHLTKREFLLALVEVANEAGERKIAAAIRKATAE